MKQRPTKPDQLGETLAEGQTPGQGLRPARKPPNLNELKKLRPEPDDLKFGRALLDDTVSELEAELPSDDEVRLDKILDRPTTGIQDASLQRYDPEAGRTNVSVKVKAVSEAVRNTVRTPFGKLLMTIPVVLAGIALSIAAVTFQEWEWIIPAAVVMPVASLMGWWRYQAWLGSRRYMYRLLESLGEDVSDFDPHMASRRIKVKRRQAGRR